VKIHKIASRSKSDPREFLSGNSEIKNNFFIFLPYPNQKTYYQRNLNWCITNQDLFTIYNPHLHHLLNPFLHAKNYVFQSYSNNFSLPSIPLPRPPYIDEEESTPNCEMQSSEEYVETFQNAQPMLTEEEMEALNNDELAQALIDAIPPPPPPSPLEVTFSDVHNEW